MSYAKKYNGYQIAKKAGAEVVDIGGHIRLARLRRSLSITQVAERATCSPLTVSRIKVYRQWQLVFISGYLCLQLDDDILLLAKEDAMGKALQDLGLKNRERASQKE